MGGGGRATPDQDPLEAGLCGGGCLSRSTANLSLWFRRASGHEHLTLPLAHSCWYLPGPIGSWPQGTGTGREEWRVDLEEDQHWQVSALHFSHPPAVPGTQTLESGSTELNEGKQDWAELL